MKNFLKYSFVIGSLSLFVSGLALGTTCNGREATRHISNLDQLINTPPNIYTLYGTSRNDTIVFDMASNLKGISVVLHLVEGEGGPNVLSFSGGTDYVCAIGTPINLEIVGGQYISTKGMVWVKATKLADDSIVNIDSAGYIQTGNGSNRVQIHTTSTSSSTTVIGGKGDDTIAVTTATNVIVIAGEGNDLIDIDLKNNLANSSLSVPAAVDAGPGDDLVSITSESSTGRALVIGGIGTDDIVTSDGSDLVYGSAVEYSGQLLGNTRVSTFRNAAIAFWQSSVNELRSFISPKYGDDLSSGIISTFGGKDYVYGTDGNDTIKSGSGNDYVKAYGGSDSLWGGTGSDTVYGDDGEDDIRGEDGNDKLHGGSGNDLIQGGLGSDTIYGDGGNDILYGNDDVDSIEGGSGSDNCSSDDTVAGCE